MLTTSARLEVAAREALPHVEWYCRNVTGNFAIWNNLAQALADVRKEAEPPSKETE